MNRCLNKLALALVLTLPLTAAACPDKTPTSASDVAAEAELDRAYAELSVLRGRVTAARVSGKLAVGSPAAGRVADELEAAVAALKRRDTVAARAAMARINAELN